MAGTRVSSRVAAKSSPRSSPRSAASTPKAKSKSAKSTPLRGSVTPKKARPTKGGAKTSPYFSKTKGKAKQEVDDEDENEDDEEGRADSPTGMTETPSPSSSDNESGDEFDPSSSEEAPDEPIESESDIDSDDLDDDDDFEKPKAKGKQNAAKRKSTGGGGSSKKVKTENGAAARLSGNGRSSNGHGHGHGIPGYEDDDEEEEDIELDEGQEIAGRIYPAPKTGQVPPGRISANTLNFLKNLQIPERNDRDWFRSHEPAFRQAENEWKAFVALVQHQFHEADNDLPILPPKDVIHRIYRDVRFSSDKTPYKRSFSLSTSRGGRKGVWAGYHLSISPNGHSILACGVWQPGKNELATIRHHLQTDPQRFREVIGRKEFVELFGPAKPHPKGSRQNVFGHDDALKVAPKGVDKDHKDIDLLKLRSVAVVHHFTDEQVLAENFKDQVKDVVAVMAPFAHLLNDFIALPATNDQDQDDGT